MGVDFNFEFTIIPCFLVSTIVGSDCDDDGLEPFAVYNFFPPFILVKAKQVVGSFECFNPPATVENDSAAYGDVDRYSVE